MSTSKTAQTIFQFKSSSRLRTCLVVLVCMLFPITTNCSCVTGPANRAKPGAIDSDAQSDFTSTPSGLKYKILRKGNGKKPTASNTVTVHYKGWLDNGKTFDSSYVAGDPISFPLTNVIPGWTEGLQYVDEGGMIELEIPSNLGYGAKGAGSDIPPNSTLHFHIELLKFR